MKNTITRTRVALTTALTAIALFAPLKASSAEITVKAKDGDAFELTGELIAFENGIYTIDSKFGGINVDADYVDCFGDACPELIDASAVVVQEGPVVWDVSLWGSRRAFTEHVEKLAELVEDKTDGELTLNISYGGLAPSRENLDGIAAGDFQMAQFCAGYHADKNPSITVLELPFLGVETMEQELAISRAVYDHPAVKEDLARWNATLLMPTPQPQYNIIGAGTPPVSLGSFQNMTVRATGGTGKAIQALGAESVNLPATEVQDALAAGEVNAVAFAPHAHMAFNTIDKAVWWTTNLNPGTANCPIVVNNQALESLPASSRVALLSSVDEALAHFIDNYKGSTMSAWETTLTERNVILLTFSDDILDAINNEVTGPAAEAWIAENASLGLPAQELYDLVTDTLEAAK